MSPFYPERKLRLRRAAYVHYRLVLKVLSSKLRNEERYGRTLITTRDFQWSWQGQRLVLGLDEAGDGALVLLLPALSSISTRGEMHPLMERLASQFRVVAIDWPGFGTRSRPNVRWLVRAAGSAMSAPGPSPT
jgi:pimeloyl-ACP methyl ester carboxylesterase